MARGFLFLLIGLLVLTAGGLISATVFRQQAHYERTAATRHQAVAESERNRALVAEAEAKGAAMETTSVHEQLRITREELKRAHRETAIAKSEAQRGNGSFEELERQRKQAADDRDAAIKRLSQAETQIQRLTEENARLKQQLAERPATQSRD